MSFLLGSAAVVFLCVLLYGGLTGRIRLRSGCCATPDPADDLRMRAAFQDDCASKVDERTGG